ncbi:hypothetical protein [Treponema saccharophilum]|uniref:YD repeat protein n=1 Tax=Treponema saccharophilum DSM 2985 TaxID=907348 RepID=H7ELB6_9SPIR|nr:hypothetical protein [Treponema saccharophilum]EIC01648.1 YD repeat protein [Treponema saccharophilum DSM 2985]BDC96958.1 hypothetical protein TRSA_20570 [Treponema saccharophilum]
MDKHDLGKKVYKQVSLNGKTIKKWVAEYIAFEFDEDGNIISDISHASEYADKAYEYDEKGNRTDLPCCFENNDDSENSGDSEYSKAVFESKNHFLFGESLQTEKIGNQSISHDRNEILWIANNGIQIYRFYFGSAGLESFQKEFDEDNNLIYIKDDNREYFFDYDEHKLLHLKKIESDGEWEKWFEYDGEKLENSKDSDGEKCLYRYDSKGCLVYQKIWHNDDDDDMWIDDYDDTSVSETEYEYDSNGKLLHRITTHYDSNDDYDSGNSSSVYEIWFEYDASGKKTISRDSAGNITKWDSFGNVVFERHHFYGEYQNEYTSDGKLIHSIHKSLDQKENCYDLDDGYDYEEKRWDLSGNLIYCRWSDREEISEYDTKNKLIHYLSKSSDENYNYEVWYEYKDGILIHKKCSDGEEYKYDSQGELTYYRDSDLKTYWNECDSKGNPIHFKSDDVEEWYEYELYDNGNIKKKICYRAI